jgi:hypothetical protein
MNRKPKKIWVFYYLDKDKNEVVTSIRECKLPKATENNLVNQMRMNRFDNVLGFGFRTLFDDEIVKPMVDKLTSKIIQNSIRYSYIHIMGKDNGVIYDCNGRVVGVD